MKINLGTRLFLSYLAVLLAGAVVLIAVARLELPRAYGRHLGLMETMMPGGMGMGQGAGRGGETAEGLAFFESFRSSFFDALALAGLVALIIALVISVLVSRWMVAPLRGMSLAAQRIAQGRYSERVELDRTDEVGALAASFNRMAGSLEQVEGRRKQLIADVAHELRTPLTTIKGSLEGLVDGVLPATPGTYEQIALEADRLNRLVDDLQELSRVEAGAFTLDLKPVLFRDLSISMKKRFALAFSKKDVGLELDPGRDLPAVLADEGRIGQVLTNLLSNALQYTPSGGKVTVIAAPEGEALHIAVKDTGVGIPSGQLAQVFDRFYRVDRSRSRQSGGGSGIGLTIARSLVEAHGGTIWVESAGEGLGSAFHFTLPLAR